MVEQNIFWHTVRIDEDQLYVTTPPYKPRRVLETASIEWGSTLKALEEARRVAPLYCTLTAILDRAKSPHLSVECGASPYRFLATMLNVLVRLVPTDVIIAMAATAISRAI